MKAMSTGLLYAWIHNELMELLSMIFPEVNNREIPVNLLQLLFFFKAFLEENLDYGIFDVSWQILFFQIYCEDILS